MTQVADPIQIEGQRLLTLPRAVSPDEVDTDYEGYYVIHTDEFHCSCRPKPWRYVHYNRKIVVWPEMDDPKMLDFACKMKELEVNPKIIEYQVTMGKAIPWDDIPDGESIG